MAIGSILTSVLTGAGSWNAAAVDAVYGRGSGPQRSDGRKGGGGELSEEDQRKVAELKKRDNEVRAHEQAHMAAGGAYVRGGATYEYEQGPDGKRYAVGGEVSIDASPIKNDPAATIRKMQQVRAAALAPANPSSQDRAVAAAAAKAAADAMVELARMRTESAGGAEKGTIDKSISLGKPPLQAYNQRGRPAEAAAAGMMLDFFA